MVSAASVNVTAFVAASVFLCTAAAARVHGSELSELRVEKIEDRVSLFCRFVPDVPSRFLIYSIRMEDSHVLVTDFEDAGAASDIFVESARPVVHVQMCRDSAGGERQVRVLYYLEREVAFRYRWEDDGLRMELRWKNEPYEYARSEIGRVTLSPSADSAVVISAHGAEKGTANAAGVTADRRKCIYVLYNASLSDSFATPVPAGFIDAVGCAEFMLPGGIPAVKMIVSASRDVSCKTDGTGLRVYPHDGDVVTAADLKAFTEEQARASADGGPREGFWETKSHRAWTFIGVGSGLALSGAVVGVLLSRKDDGGGGGSGQIPDIENVITLPAPQQ